MKNELVLFTDGEVNIEVQISPEQETVWLRQKQMEILFEVKHATISEHISNICLPEKQYILYFDGKQIPVFERACEITLLLKSVLLPGQN